MSSILMTNYFDIPCADVVTIDKTGEHFRLIYDVKGRFTIHRISAEEAKVISPFFFQFVSFIHQSLAYRRPVYVKQSIRWFKTRPRKFICYDGHCQFEKYFHDCSVTQRSKDIHLSDPTRDTFCRNNINMNNESRNNGFNLFFVFFLVRLHFSSTNCAKFVKHNWARRTFHFWLHTTVAPSGIQIQLSRQMTPFNWTLPHPRSPITLNSIQVSGSLERLNHLKNSFYCKYDAFSPIYRNSLSLSIFLSVG